MELPQTPGMEQSEQKLSSLNRTTPLSKYFTFALFVILPFVGVYVGYYYAPEKVVEVETVVYRDSNKQMDMANNERIHAATADETAYPFTITNVQVSDDALLVPRSVNEKIEYILTWEYAPGPEGEPQNAMISATIVDENDNQISWLKGVTEYDKERAVFSLATVCALSATEGCIPDSVAVGERLRVKIGGGNCLLPNRNPGYCYGGDKQNIEPTYSNWFTLQMQPER